MKKKKIIEFTYLSIFLLIVSFMQPIFVNANSDVNKFKNLNGDQADSLIKEMEIKEKLNSWVEIDDNYFYYYDEHTNAIGEVLIDEALYYFNQEGILIGKWNDDHTKFQFTDGNNVKNEWLDLSGKRYYFNKNGIKIVGWQKINKDWYYFDSEGIMQIGWQEINGKWYYLRKSGEMVNKNYLIREKLNVFSSNGVWQGNWEKNRTGWWFKNPNKSYPKNQWKKINEKWYYFDKNGYMNTGWLQFNNYWYYLKSSGEMVNQNSRINNKTHLFSSSGIWQGNWEKNRTGWWFKNPNKSYPKNQWKKINGKWYYFNKNGYMRTGWTKIKNKWYYLNPSGAMENGWTKVKGKWYFLSSNGSMRTGWVKLKNKWYYLNKNGHMQTNWNKINNKWYYMNSSGVMQTDWINIKGKKYYFQSSGAMVEGNKKLGNELHVFTQSGVWQGSWIKNNKKWQFKNYNNKLVKEQWEKIKNKWYYFDKNSFMTTGWQQVKNKWYYMNSSGVMQTGWKKIGNKWYYMYSNGVMASNTVVNGYFVGKDGAWKNNGGSLLKGKTIMLDPGHGGNWPTGDPGAVNNALKIKEKDLNNALTKEIAKVLKAYGAKVVYTRTPDQEINPSLQKRVELANKAKPDLFLSIHHDSSTNKSTSGISTHWSSYRPGLNTKGTYIRYKGKNYPFVREHRINGVSHLVFKMNGKEVTKSIYEASAYNSTPTKIAQKSKEFSDILFNSVNSLGFSNTSYKKDGNLYVTRWVNSPAILFEAGFISNTTEVKRIIQPKFRKQIAEKVGEAIVTFLNN